MFKYFLVIGLLLMVIYAFYPGAISAKNIDFSDEEGYRVLELFTSQSCSSCPAADAFLQELDKHDKIITLSCNVTYWNHLHWEDNLSKDFCTERQRDYSSLQNRAGRIFTPELMINGEKSLVGSDRGKIVDYLTNESRTVAPLTLRLEGDDVEVLPSNFSELKNNTVLLIAYGDEHTQYVPSGENRGRTIKYSNPVLNMKPIVGNWDGQSPLTAKIETATVPKGYVVLVADKKGKIVAAGKIAL